MEFHEDSAKLYTKFYRSPCINRVAKVMLSVRWGHTFKIFCNIMFGLVTGECNVYFVGI